MKKFLPFAFIVAIASCNQVDSIKKDVTIPNMAATVEAVKDALQGRSYEVNDAGTINVFNEFDWSSASADTSEFYREYMQERKKFALQFVNDTAAQVVDEKAAFKAVYSLEKDTGSAVLLHLKYIDSSFSFNPGEPMMVTSTYKVRGIDDKQLLLETPREMNRQKVILLLKKK